ncbi:MAG: hypothetical protein ACRDRK_12255 [Pseudonocardia sp.]
MTASERPRGSRDVLSRRERRRRDTLVEIAQVARDLISDGREVTFRALANDMGMTPSALYRYVDNAAALNELIADAVFRSLSAEIFDTGRGYDESDPAARIVAAATAFRGWALENKVEFKLLFTTATLTVSASASRSASGQDAVGGDVGELFTMRFGTMFRCLQSERRFPVPTVEELDPGFVAAYGSTDSTVFGEEASAGSSWLFELGWMQMLGVIAVEVFGHVRPQLVSSGSFFLAQMREIGRRSGMEEDWDRLDDVCRSVMARRAVTGPSSRNRR